ncbi:MAG: PLP-dependent aspartate aminotransferase family protein [Pseudomonadales bacterium]|jgi:cystathionine beta-lyase/cystathionine gamma-synthase|nr:PLP-dependent aspartate aminotransferase family protein [Pseudomonadales bacterium]
MSKGWRPETRLIRDGVHADAVYGAVIPPLYQNSTFAFPDWASLDAAFEDRRGTPVYSRQLNPTVRAAEAQLAALAGAEGARLFPSGMSAITAAILHCVTAGDHIVTIRNVYGPAATLMGSYLPEKMGVRTTFVGGDDLDELRGALGARTRLIYLESPSSAKFGLQDIEAVVALARPLGIRVVIDNTWATPLFQKPLALGVDLEVHSVSKYLGGHSDLVAGVVMGGAADIDAIATREAELLGGKMSPFEAWLLLRSLRTLPERMAAHERNGLAVARFLEADPRVARVRHPGLDSHPQRALALRQMTGSSGLIGFTLATEEVAAIKRFFDGLELFGRGVSWGGHESLVYAPAISYLKEQPPERFAEMGLAAGDMRISVGLEHPEDLIDDLRQALDRI